MLGRVFTGLAVLLCLSGLYGQVDFRQSIRQDYLMRDVYTLAADSFEGRRTGEYGQHKAADYLISVLEENTVPAYGESYKQSFGLWKKNLSGELWNQQNKLVFPRDFGFSSIYEPFQFEGTIPVYASVKEAVKSSREKVICIQAKSLMKFDIRGIKKLNVDLVIVACEMYQSDYFSSKIDDEDLAFQGIPKTKLIYVSASKLKDLSTGKIDIKLDLNPGKKAVETENVVAWIEGSDPKLKKEFVVISGHYDHLGIHNGKVHNGADDNGTGSATMLELARLFRLLKEQGKGSKRSLLFVWFTGEEMGLFGSRYYTTHPMVPLEKTIVNLNIDMIGRNEDGVEDGERKIFLVGADRISKRLHEISSETAAKKSGLVLDYKYNDRKDPLRLYYRSDHYNFAEKGIPCIFYFGGFHKDYHQATDDAEKIDFIKVREVALLVAHTAWELLNMEGSLK
ncbi:MAG: M28 family peptidase [Bacteroidetes bacterium]|nr:MAG: M28 family peptidase [Bacteroidota bacterium]